MPDVRMAMWVPSRSDQIVTSAATIHCRVFGAAPPIGHSALPAPTSPTEKVQIVSTQPELPVRCCTIQAPAIRIEREAAIRTRAARRVSAMQIPDISGGHRTLPNTRDDNVRFQRLFPF